LAIEGLPGISGKAGSLDFHGVRVARLPRRASILLNADYADNRRMSPMDPHTERISRAREASHLLLKKDKADPANGRAFMRAGSIGENPAVV
jgi:hypothetical protein